MNLRSFFKSLAALAAIPFIPMPVRAPELVRVYPKTPEEFIGCTVRDRLHSYVIASEAERLGFWQGREFNNYRRNKFWAVGPLPTRNRVLACIWWPLAPENPITFWKQKS